MAYKIGQTMKAKFSGVCKVTGNKINVGDEIVYQNAGWCLAPKKTEAVTTKDSIQPKKVDELWWKTDLAQIIGKELTQDFELASPITLVAWDEDKKKLVNLICAKNKYTGRNFLFTGMFDAAMTYHAVGKGTPVIKNVNGTDYVVVEAVNHECWAMDSIVGDYDEYSMKRNSEIKIKELVAKGWVYEDAAEAVFNGMYD